MTGELGRAIRRAGSPPAPEGERCDLCAFALQEVAQELRQRTDARVLVGNLTLAPGDANGDPPPAFLSDTDRREIRCVCQACSLLFSRDAASDGHYRLVPRRRLRLPAVPTEDLGVPVGLAFFVPRTDGTVDAHYPSPAGATRSEVDQAAWRDVVAH